MDRFWLDRVKAAKGARLMEISREWHESEARKPLNSKVRKLASELVILIVRIEEFEFDHYLLEKILESATTELGIPVHANVTSWLESLIETTFSEIPKSRKAFFQALAENLDALVQRFSEEFFNERVKQMRHLDSLLPN